MSDKTPKRHDWTVEDHAAYRAEIVRTAQRKRRQLAKENGLCSICCRNIPEAGHKTCKSCRVKITEANYKRYWRDKNGQKRDD